MSPRIFISMFSVPSFSGEFGCTIFLVKYVKAVFCGLDSCPHWEQHFALPLIASWRVDITYFKVFSVAKRVISSALIKNLALVLGISDRRWLNRVGAIGEPCGTEEDRG